MALPLAGAYAIDLEPHRDERGSFARFWDADAFRARGLARGFAQSSLSHNPRRGTLRGLHYQLPPRAEAKLVLCVRGSIWDVIVDLRRVQRRIANGMRRRSTANASERCTFQKDSPTDTSRSPTTPSSCIRYRGDTTRSWLGVSDGTIPRSGSSGQHPPSSSHRGTGRLRTWKRPWTTSADSQSPTRARIPGAARSPTSTMAELGLPRAQ